MNSPFAGEVKPPQALAILKPPRLGHRWAPGFATASSCP
jgi:hypothetical protein